MKPLLASSDALVWLSAADLDPEVLHLEVFRVVGDEIGRSDDIGLMMQGVMSLGVSH